MKFAGVVLLVVGLTAASFCQDLSTVVIPSEDELYDAFILGEIDYYQYLRLKEILIHGIDSSDFHLLDEIPNLSFFVTPRTTTTDLLTGEQQAAFIRTEPAGGRYSSFVMYRHYREVEAPGRYGYRNSYGAKLGDCWSFTLQLQREYSGRERIISRHIGYQNRRSIVREVRLGSYTRRLGLGTVFGYHGKLLASSNRISNESLLFPDYGGLNGAYGRVVSRGMMVEGLMSVMRDSDYSLLSSGLLVAFDAGNVRPGLLLGRNVLRRRSTGETVADVKYGLTSRLDYDGGHTSLEFCLQSGERRGWGAVVVEGGIDPGATQLRYALWFYGDEYIDLTGGSKAGNVHSREELATLEFDYSAKRTGQKGCLLRSLVPLDANTNLINSFIYAMRNTDSVDVQFLGGVERTVGPGLMIRLDYLNKARRRTDAADGGTVVKQRSRGETIFTAGDLRVRSYIAYNTETGKYDNLSVFVNLKLKTQNTGAWDLWSNASRINLGRGGIDYWYGYLRHSQALDDHLEGAVKLGHTYNRHAGLRHLTTFSFELRAAI
ncbi:MAG: hypothetical protein OEW00_00670 [candidate division Zixibacteria bacterium]|nr:hypothetical protein [candidate division Zixibacteria bacterium]